jgi:hypothetical protein
LQIKIAVAKRVLKVFVGNILMMGVYAVVLSYSLRPEVSLCEPKPVMNNFLKYSDSKKIRFIFLLFLFAILSNGSVFSQNLEKKSVVTSSSNEESIDNKSAANMEFVLWFMSSKQDPNSIISTEGINTKKQIMSSGLMPNRLLMKAFLKKAINYEIAVV